MEDHFRNQLHDMETTPPAAVWQQLESRLPNRKRKAAIFWLSAAASIILLLGTVAYFGSQQPNEQMLASKSQISASKTSQQAEAITRKESAMLANSQAITTSKTNPAARPSKTSRNKALQIASNPKSNTAQIVAGQALGKVIGVEKEGSQAAAKSDAIAETTTIAKSINALETEAENPAHVVAIQEAASETESFTMQLKPEIERPIDEPKKFSIRKALQTVADLKSGEKTPGQVLKQEGLALNLPNFLRKNGRE
jgi:cytoskeletal protein RodZ